MKVMSGSLLGSLPYLVMGIVVQVSGYLADRTHNRSGPDSDVKVSQIDIKKLVYQSICKQFFLIKNKILQYIAKYNYTVNIKQPYKS